jgi:hypothetical protein
MSFAAGHFGDRTLVLSLFKDLVHRVISRRHTVGFKRVCMRGVSEEHIRCDTQRNEQRRRRTLFKPTLLAVVSWVIFRVAHSLRIDLDMLVVRALKIN